MVIINAHIDLWLKDIAPSHKLRSWFAHDSDKWDEFKQRYFIELDNKNEFLKLTFSKVKESDTTSFISVKDENYSLSHIFSPL